MSGRNDCQKIISTAGLLLIDALVFHEVIAREHSEIRTLSQIQSSGSVKREIEETWQYVVDQIDYVPVFHIALGILRSLPSSSTLEDELHNLVYISMDIASSKVLLRHDLFGRLYHKLLLGKLVKYYATFYTSIPAARLLAGLIFQDRQRIRTDKNPPTYNKKPIKIVDFACGSGTLLSAAYKELATGYKINAKKLDVEGFHRYLIEQGIWGFDVLQHAIHLAATTLSISNPFTVRGSELYVMPMGASKDDFHLGSLDFIRSPRLVVHSNTRISEDVEQPEKSGAKRLTIRSMESSTIELPDFDVCIMNPPFTRSVGGNLLFGSLPEEERGILQKELSAILKAKGWSGIGQAGLAAVFVFLGDLYLKQDGKIGLVLPRAFLSGVSWSGCRRLLLDNYHIQFIVTSFENGKNWNFSENTDLSEVLIVARKRVKKNKKDANQRSVFVNLWRKPKNEIEAIRIASQIKSVELNSSSHDISNINAAPFILKDNAVKSGEIYSGVLSDLDFGEFSFFSQMELNRVQLRLREGIVYIPDKGVIGNFKNATLAEMGGAIGPDRSQVHSSFIISTSRSNFSAFWGYDSESVKTILEVPNMFLHPKNDRTARNLASSAGNLLVVERARLTTYPVLASYLEEPVLSNVWWPVKIDRETGKILSLWLNSTLGLLSLLAATEVTEGPWVALKKETLTNLRLFDVRGLTQKQKATLLSLYDNVCRKHLRALPQEFTNPVVRKEIDDVFLRVMGIEGNLTGLYKMLAEEIMFKD